MTGSPNKPKVQAALKNLFSHFQDINRMTPRAKKYNAESLVDKYQNIVAKLAIKNSPTTKQAPSKDSN